MIRRSRDRRVEGSEDRLTSLERELAESEAQREMLERALYEVNYGIVVFGASDDVAFMNRESTRLIRPSTTLSQITPHSLQRLVRTARESGSVAEQEIEIGRPARIVLARVSPRGDGGVVLMLSDVTDTRRTEAVRRDFVASASHELKTPVASAQASAEALQLALERDPAAARQFADQVEASTRQLASLVADLLDLSRLETSQQYDEQVALDEVVESEVAAIADRAQESGISIVTNAEPVQVVGSRADLGLALRNLLDNALRHTSTGGQVTVAVTQIENAVTLDVIDTGEGIASRELPRIFERFYRVDSARSRATGGTGLGLAIVRHVVEAHGGTIEVTSTLGEGTTFSIRLPSP